MEIHAGMIGLGTMGRNLTLNMADKGYSICGYDKDEAQRSALLQEGAGKPVHTAHSLPDLVAQLQPPRIIILLVPAGIVVTKVLEELQPLLQKGDVVIDGGNSYYMDTARHYRDLETNGIHYIGMGVSGGEDGARHGPSLMPGGDKSSYELVAPILKSIAAISDDGPCVAYMGNTAAGHYVKMVHNGIEYAMMQLLTEIYDLLKHAGNFTNQQLHTFFASWEQTSLQSFLAEVTADIFTQPDEETGNDLVDVILDKARQKGTGMWTSQSAMELNVPVPMIDAAVTMRFLSSMKDERIAAEKKLGTIILQPNKTDQEALAHLCMQAMYFGQALAYGQGLHLLSVASATYSYKTQLIDVIRVWKNGCIIRSAMLNELSKVWHENPGLTNIIMSDHFGDKLKDKRSAVAALVKLSIDHRLSLPCFNAALNYYDAYNRGRLPANLIQAQRDFFGAHLYERIDKTGRFHTDWNKPTTTAS